MVADDDWRIGGQENFLSGVTFTWRRWFPYRPGWDHDHCSFCWVHLCDHVLEDDPDTQLEGWVSADNYNWVCGTCFEDFRERFDLRVDPHST